MGNSQSIFWWFDGLPHSLDVWALRRCAHRSGTGSNQKKKINKKIFLIFQVDWTSWIAKINPRCRCGEFTSKKKNLKVRKKNFFKVAIHAIGDLANHRVLSIFENVTRRNQPRDRRFRVEHAQTLRWIVINVFQLEKKHFLFQSSRYL